MVAYAGFFDDIGKARAVLQTLKDNEYDNSEVLLIEPAKGDDLKKALSHAKNRDYLTKALAERVSGGLEGGRTLVVVKARLGGGRMVEKLYADNGGEIQSTWSDASRHKFFSDYIGLPLVSESRPMSKGPPEAKRPITEFLYPCVIQRKGTRDSSFGLPLLGKGLLFSSMLGMPLLSKRKTKDK